MSQSEFKRLVQLLSDAGVSFDQLEHEPVLTSHEAATARGARLSQGVKALVVKVKRKEKEFFVVIDLPADRKLDWKKAKKALQASDCRMASQQEVLEQTGCEPGGVPPLGHAKKLPVLADLKVFEEDSLEFNAGLRTKSIRVKSEGLKKAFDSMGVAYFDFCE